VTELHATPYGSSPNGAGSVVLLRVFHRLLVAEVHYHPLLVALRKLQRRHQHHLPLVLAWPLESARPLLKSARPLLKQRALLLR